MFLHKPNQFYNLHVEDRVNRVKNTIIRILTIIIIIFIPFYSFKKQIKY